MLPKPPEYFIDKLTTLQRALRDCVIERRGPGSRIETISAVADERDGDVIYVLDAHVEETLFDFCREWSREMPFVLIAEGVPGSGWRAFPESASPADGRFLVIVDPIDGTRGIMYDKRSGWVLSGVAPNLGARTCLADIEVAAQSEIPTSKQYLADVLWAVKDGGAHAERDNLLTGGRQPFTPVPSRAGRVDHGFATISKFFPAGRTLVSRIEERLFGEVVGEMASGNPLTFDDEYIASGGQLYELMMGHDRFVADLRPWVFNVLGFGESSRLCAHPYDLCTELIAREAGAIVTDLDGGPLRNRLDIRENVSWIGYANATIREMLEAPLRRIMGDTVKSKE